ncbi:hypothetical protein PAXRUDRAFT_27641 [Paxillus rubicundulus Ve08.2h10]|uniref:CCHC-type domain-containing protein n=1 Tax=Paxillus rubicundulus Ve08.2h10 TaxID=930991 RepID=A0A0D0DKJ8_9AGAM|nr:hypothetical protein PAXRUDRAFT_27641 [Paxillus rubicundulus Ve08.2h10]
MVEALEKLRLDTETKDMIAQGALKATLDQMEEAADGIMNNFKDVKNVVNLLTPSLKSMQTRINALHLHLTTPPPSTMPNPNPNPNHNITTIPSLYSDTQRSSPMAQSAQTCSALVNDLGIQAIIKDQLFPILVPYLPISSTLEAPAALHNIEQENGIATGSLIQAKWDGVYHKQEKFFPRKDKKEAITCMHCQLWGHIARDCNANEDTWVTHTEPQNVTTPTSSTVTCKEFEQHCANLNAKLPENLMPYYPTNVEWTQASLPPKAHLPQRERVAKPKTTQGGGMRQTTLNNLGYGSLQIRPVPMRQQHGELPPPQVALPTHTTLPTPSPPSTSNPSNKMNSCLERTSQ